MAIVLASTDLLNLHLYNSEVTELYDRYWAVGRVLKFKYSEYCRLRAHWEVSSPIKKELFYSFPILRTLSRGLNKILRKNSKTIMEGFVFIDQSMNYTP